jgi:hypothetical protein
MFLPSPFGIVHARYAPALGPYVIQCVTLRSGPQFKKMAAAGVATVMSIYLHQSEACQGNNC